MNHRGTLSEFTDLLPYTSAYKKESLRHFRRMGQIPKRLTHDNRPSVKLPAIRNTLTDCTRRSSFERSLRMKLPKTREDISKNESHFDYFALLTKPHFVPIYEEDDGTHLRGLSLDTLKRLANGRKHKVNSYDLMSRTYGTFGKREKTQSQFL
ncbi:hypothetical protein CSKR_203623 [Clonorchis sinensis]|uniref:Uncharacterized protein n=1 Tax=Clonorchis sinensis TaxID=79923 RepID=A0A8T1MUS0_CLOSI|nr:hypothetical protein CSKR_203623 [Clonorchis sinensis]